MADSELNIVTGAFGYSGRYIAARLTRMGRRIVTLTRQKPGPQTPDELRSIKAMTPRFDDADALAEQMRGATTLYNTYWVRYCHGKTTFDNAVDNTRTLIRAAEQAGLERIVHVSITNPSADSRLPYFRGKALLEEAVEASALSHAIIRPTVIFGPQDILINNIAWMLRRLPVFGVFGDGAYRIQPIFVEDFADLVVQSGQHRDNVTLDATGPETFTYADMVRLIRDTIGARARIIHVSPSVALVVGKIVGWAVRDVTITRDEIEGLMAGLLVSDKPPTGNTSLRTWLQQNAATVGRAYASELGRHYR